MEVEGQAAATGGAAAAREQARRYRTGRQAQMTPNQRKRMKKLKAHGQGKYCGMEVRNEFSGI